MNERPDGTARDPDFIDFRTGVVTGIDGESAGEYQRAACAALNERRTRGILEVRQETQRREPVPADVWGRAFAGKLREWEVPLIPLERLGLRVDEDGVLESDFLKPLKSGAEACPFWDQERGVVYKLFDVRANGTLGKKLELEKRKEGPGYVLNNGDADLFHTVQKLSALNEVGAHPTEVVGFTESGDFLVAKQPLAQAYEDFAEDLREACDLMKAYFPGQATVLGRSCAVFWALGQPWLLADLHKGNIMKDASGQATVIDALVGSISPSAWKRMGWLAEACGDARRWAETGIKPYRDLFDGVSDDEL